MKKRMLLGLAALVMFALIGMSCDEGVKNIIIGEKPDEPITSGSWTKGLNDFDVQTGDNPGEIKYKFTATDPAADSYTLYIGPGGLNKGDAIILLNNKKSVIPQSNFTTLDGFTAGTSFSVIIEAKKDGTTDYARSGVKQVTAKENPSQFKLTVNNIPNAATGKTWGASLLAPGDSSTPVAIGMQDSSKAFVFYHPNATATYPDFTKPFTTSGTYALAIASADLATQQPEEIYTYKGTITYSTNITSIPVNWSDFSKMGGEPSVNSTVITIDNKPANVNLLVVLDGITQKAIGTNTGNAFALFEPGLLGPDTSKPWKGSGNYSIMLLNGITPVASYVRISGGTTSTLYTFTGQETITLNYSNDFIAVP